MKYICSCSGTTDLTTIIHGYLIKDDFKIFNFSGELLDGLSIVTGTTFDTSAFDPLNFDVCATNITHTATSERRYIHCTSINIASYVILYKLTASLTLCEVEIYAERGNYYLLKINS